MSRTAGCTWSWTTAGNDNGDWSSGCGHEYYLVDGTPKQNGMAFCCFCGDRLVTQIPKPKRTITPEGRE